MSWTSIGKNGPTTLSWPRPSWPQADFASAQHRWPGLLDPEVSFEQYRTQTESHMREIAAGCTRIQLVEAGFPVRALQMLPRRGGPFLGSFGHD